MYFFLGSPTLTIVRRRERTSSSLILTWTRLGLRHYSRIILFYNNVQGTVPDVPSSFWVCCVLPVPGVCCPARWPGSTRLRSAERELVNNLLTPIMKSTSARRETRVTRENLIHFDMKMSGKRAIELDNNTKVVFGIKFQDYLANVLTQRLNQ